MALSPHPDPDPASGARPGRRAARLAGLAVALATLVLGAAPSALAAQRTIVSPGPLDRIYLNDNLACQVEHVADPAHPEFFGGNDPGACGTFLAVGGTVYGPSVPAAPARRGFTPVSQSAVTGNGSAANPYRVVTVVDAGALRLREVDTYVRGQENFRTQITVSNRGASSVGAALYRAADCYLQESDSGYGWHDSSSGGIYCTRNPNNSPQGRILGFVPLSGGASFVEAGYSSVWAAINGSQFPNTCACATSLDNGAGLSWGFAVAPGRSVTRSLATALSPSGVAPDTTPPAITLSTPEAGFSTRDLTPRVAGAAGDAAGDSATVTVSVYSGRRASGRRVQRLRVRRSGAAWSATLRRLAPSTYTVQAEQRDGAGNVGRSSPLTFSVVLPPPVLGRQVNLRSVRGVVYVSVPGRRGRGGAQRGRRYRPPVRGRRFVRLRGADQVPVGSLVDTRAGRVRLTSATAVAGQTQTSDFYSGAFKVSQSRRRRAGGLTQLRLIGSNFGSCPRARRATVEASAAARRAPRRRLRGKGKGKFRTRGRSAAATVRGTTWLTEDRCDGTLVRVSQGRVSVRDLVRRRTVTVGPGQSYFARR